ncbi:MAG: hypothetical protein K6G26_04495 [Lachnospiraceae bacterium]|nr:hypothetical protein [Lachnospiraceae bacterium]
MENNKKKYIIIGIIVLVFFGMITSFTLIYIKEKKREIAEKNEIANFEKNHELYYHITIVYYTAELIFKTEDNEDKIGAVFEQGFKNEIRDDTVELFDNIDLDDRDIGVYNIAHLIYLDNKWNLGYKDKLINALKKYYNEDYKLFNNLDVSYDNQSEDDIENMALGYSTELLSVSKECEIDLSEYKLTETIADKINTIISGNYKRITEGRKVQVYETIKKMCKLGYDNYLDKEKALEFINYCCKDHYESIINGECEKNFDNLDSDSLIFKKALGFSYDASDYMRETLRELNSDEKLEYDKYAPVFIIKTARKYDDILEYTDYDTYFSQNIVDMVEDNYDAVFTGEISRILLKNTEDYFDEEENSLLEDQIKSIFK